MVVTASFVEKTYPLHFLVWHNRAEELDACIKNSEPETLDLDKLDPRGRTPLFLAISLNHQECAEILLQHNADTNFEHGTGWTVVHEATCSGNPELLGSILKYRDQQRRARRTDLIPKLLQRLKDAPDFYVEMKWEFTSWVPLVTRMCPTNTHRVYKMGSYLRVDSSDAGFDDQSWSKGAVSVIFQGRDDTVKILEVDHGTGQVFTSALVKAADEANIGLPDSSIAAYQNSVSHRLSNPAIISYVNLEKIAFERNKTGIWGWGSDKSEKVDNYECKVFAATNVELITKMRYEHLAEADKNKGAGSLSNLQKMFGMSKNMGGSAGDERATSASPSEGASASVVTTTAGASAAVKVTLEEYFDKDHDLQGADVGRSKEITTKINKFKATVWLSENYPLNLPEQLMPIVDIMALSSSQFSKLKDFIQMQIPSGFPLKIEIPLFHLVNACITFHNIFGTDEQVSGVNYLEEENGRLSCVLDEQLFEPPAHYVMRNAGGLSHINTGDEDFFPWSSEESPEKMDIYQALNAPRSLIREQFSPDSDDAEEQLLQRAIEESLLEAREQQQQGFGSVDVDQVGLGVGGGAAAGLARSESMEQLQMVLDMSMKELEDEARLRHDEEEALKRVLELSLHEK